MIPFFKYFRLFIIPVFFIQSCDSNTSKRTPIITGEFKQWHKIVLTFEGPVTNEKDTINPFLDYRLQATFTNKDKTYIIPGYYAADGNASESSADSGNKWQVIFCPDDYGLWNYEISFMKGTNIAVDEFMTEGEEVFFNGAIGEFLINPTNKTGKDFRAKGRIKYVNEHHLEFQGTGEVFLKGGADSPENFLAYNEFDNTYYGGKGDRRIGEAGPNQSLHNYLPHIDDWKSGDPTWKNGTKGKGIIGAVNYLASKNINSIYMLTNNVAGDGMDVFPWIAYDSDFTRFDVSKLAQWEIVFSHMDNLGLMCHFVTQETENELLLDSGSLGLTRKLYYRELIARFSHHLGITWNLGEENGPAPWVGYGQNDRQRKDMAKYLKETDPYENYLVVHTLPNHDLRDEILTKLLGFPYLDGPSLQTEIQDVHSETIKWRSLSEKQGKKWVVCSDEIGPAKTGAKPDKNDINHDKIRKEVLWGNLMAGGGGVEWYFGYEYDHNDLNCENFRSREQLWEQTAVAIQFFKDHIPIKEMEPSDNLVSPNSNYCLTNNNDLILIFIPVGGASSIQLDPTKSYSIEWFDPKNGGELFQTESKLYKGISELNFSIQGEDTEKDWVALLKAL